MPSGVNGLVRQGMGPACLASLLLVDTDQLLDPDLLTVLAPCAAAVRREALAAAPLLPAALGRGRELALGERRRNPAAALAADKVHRRGDGVCHSASDHSASEGHEPA